MPDGPAGPPVERHGPVAAGRLSGWPGTAAWEARDWQDHYRERAGILEHDGGLPRREAERRVFRECLALWLAANPPPPCPPDRCACCGGPVPPRAEGAVPLLRSTAGPKPDHVWVHERCLAGFCRSREAQARDALLACSVGEPS